ncbi:MAG: adenosylmethionine--8-amino-7-oxononanoate transaminase [Deltaproteobacteria bacterium]|nr:adenosylmethionine--8-amino-7-oxononanoate transaminase [Deltaproteobacteria bacterium]
MAHEGDWAARDRRYVWHPFTQMTEWFADETIVIASGKGNYLFDTRGRRYFDGVSSLWVNIHGHRHPRITKAIKEQLDRIAHSTFLGLSNVPATELAERLVAVAPKGLRRVFYSDNGSTAVEVAMKMAFQYHRQNGPAGMKRTEFVTLGDAYHGDTIGSVSLGGIDLFHRIYRPLLFKVHRVPSPWKRKEPIPKRRNPASVDVLAPLAKIFGSRGDRIAALVMEPLVQGAAGILVHPRGFLREAARICRGAGALLILDEVATGFGRTGPMFACEQEGVRPDLMAVAKGLTGGYLPVAVTLTTEKVFKGFLGPPGGDRTFFHGHSYTANPLGCAAAIANLDIFRDEPVLERVGVLISRFRGGLARFRDIPAVADVRQCGLMVGIDLMEDPAGGKAFDPLLRIGHKVILAARKRGVIIRPLGDVIVLMPPLSTTDAELDMLLQATYESVEEATRAGGIQPRRPQRARSSVRSW